jgi:uncharacterized protein YdeI (YjbR/CyaY-like superfamily)
MGIQDREHIEATVAQDFVSWLEANHNSSAGVWVVTYKKAAGNPAPTYDELVRAAMCFGWVDSVPGKVDEMRSKLYFSPRKPGSAWSQSNKIRVAELEGQGLMRPAGMAAVEAAKASGAWSKIDSAQNLEIPDDLAAALRAYSGSRENFEAFPQGVRKQILEWISLAKTAETRSRRIDETARLAGQNIRANQWRDKKNAVQGS